MSKTQKLKLFIGALFFLFIAGNVKAQSQDTISKCIKEMESTTPEIRQQAAMILGKYEDIEVTQVLLSHLTDTSNLVRRAVLVSLQDRMQKRMVSISSMAQVLDLLEDKDVEVRRLASASAQFFIGLLLRDNPNNINQRNSSQPFFEEQKKIKAKLLKSLNDSDEIVRLNNLTTIAQNSQLIMDANFKTAVLARINDTNKSIVILALDLSQIIDSFDAKAIAQKLIDNPEPDILSALIKILALKGFTDPEIWQKLATKPNLEVAAKAIETGFELGIKDMENQYSLFILDSTNPLSLRIKLLHHLNQHSKKVELMNSLLEEKNSTIILETIKLSPQILGAIEVKVFLKKYLQDSSASIKEVATNLLFQFITNTDNELLKLLFASDKSQTRLLVLEKLDILRINNDEIILEALMDDTKAVRLKAFELCAKNISSNAQLKTMLIRSMEDPDPEITNAALKVMPNYAKEPEMLLIYAKFIEKGDDLVKIQIAETLRKYKQPEAQTILTTLSQDKNIRVSTAAHLSLYQKGDLKSLEILAKNILSKELTLRERLNLQQIISSEKLAVQQPFATLLTDGSEDLRFNCIKFFNLNRDLYQENFINAIFTETNKDIIAVTSEIYLFKKFQNLATIKKLLTADDQRVKNLGLRILAENYADTMYPIVTDLIKTDDTMSIFYAIEIIKRNNLQTGDQLIIEKLKGKTDKIIRPHLLYALLILNTENALQFMKTIDEKNELYPELLTAQRIKKQAEDNALLNKPKGKLK